MNPAAILGLLGSLYENIATLQARIAELEKQVVTPPGTKNNNDENTVSP